MEITNENIRKNPSATALLIEEFLNERKMEAKMIDKILINWAKWRKVLRISLMKLIIKLKE
ncbi:hypothetical protein DFO73_102284 [Cytobacillus oceanisediminis]|uniref:Uncharacterized protein n=1 Tax=Cytobacillus oceanisediminis TaxID=665099 RepID=A0A2V3A3X0_9BACI|nr:hypothetical protein [Cytobacillus oceanisediminis]PWW31288.1 hypothetical protein DFO73_102284 [Cytobacillus oceanisediminis]